MGCVVHGVTGSDATEGLALALHSASVHLVAPVGDNDGGSRVRRWADQPAFVSCLSSWGRQVHHDKEQCVEEIIGGRNGWCQVSHGVEVAPLLL